MFGINWTNTDQGDKQELPPAAHYRLFALTVIAFIVMYGLVALPFLWVARPFQERWPILLLPATPFVTVLGTWKLVVWFGFWRVIVAALATALVGTLSHPLWMQPLLNAAPASTHGDWVGSFVIFCGLTGWLMAGAALLIGPIRLVIGWLRHRRERSAEVPTKRQGP